MSERSIINPPTVAPPGPYSHGVAVSGATRTLYVSGQVGIKPDGSLAEGIEAQTKTAFENLTAVITHAGMTMQDIVKLTIYLVDPETTPGFMQAGGPFLTNPPPAITLLFVKGLINPALLVEIEAVATA